MQITWRLYLYAIYLQAYYGQSTPVNNIVLFSKVDIFTTCFGPIGPLSSDKTIQQVNPSYNAL
jgi:hypothetical protein